MQIIAFGHAKRVGKDTASRFLATAYRLTPEGKGKNILKRGFAYKLKEVCHQLYGWAGLKSPEYYDKNEFEKEEVLLLLGKSPRDIWIEISNKIREIYSETWLDYLFQYSQNEKVDLLIIPDLRYPNEARVIKRMGGFCIKITRAEIDHTSDVADDALLKYQNWDTCIDNDGTIGEFYSKVITICGTLLGVNLE